MVGVNPRPWSIAKTFAYVCNCFSKSAEDVRFRNYRKKKVIVLNKFVYRASNNITYFLKIKKNLTRY